MKKEGKVSAVKNAVDTQEIMTALVETQNKLQSAQIAFQYVSDPYLVESYIYRINSLQALYGYFLKKAKEAGVQDLRAFNRTG